MESYKLDSFPPVFPTDSYFFTYDWRAKMALVCPLFQATGASDCPQASEEKCP
jgi:hypothetical protein